MTRCIANGSVIDEFECPYCRYDKDVRECVNKAIAEVGLASESEIVSAAMRHCRGHLNPVSVRERVKRVLVPVPDLVARIAIEAVPGPIRADDYVFRDASNAPSPSPDETESGK